MDVIYRFILKVLQPFVIFTGKLYAPWSRKKVTGEHYYLLRDKIKVGTVLLSTTNGEFSNLINPEKIKHAALYVGDIKGTGVRYVIEAVGTGVRLNDLVTFLTTKDLVIGCDPNFLTDEDRVLLPHEALKIIGIPYDYLFEKGAKSFYCFEAITYVYNLLRPEIQFKCREILKGKNVYSYQTFLYDEEKFNVVFNSDEI